MSLALFLLVLFMALISRRAGKFKEKSTVTLLLGLLGVNQPSSHFYFLFILAPSLAAEQASYTNSRIYNVDAHDTRN